MKSAVNIGKHVIPVWLIGVILTSGITAGVVGYYLWDSITIDLEVEEPLEILSYPDELTLFPGETEEFNVTIMNHASIEYAVNLECSLDNETYQNEYVTFGDATYTVVSGQQNLSVWISVQSNAPPIKTALDISLSRIVGHEFFFDDFNDGLADGWTEHLGSWSVVDGEYFVSVGLVENGISTVDDLTLADYSVETKLRFADTEVGFRAGIVFNYIDDEHYYSLEMSNEYNTVALIKYTADYGVGIDSTGNDGYPVESNTEYRLKLVVHENTFTGFVDGEEIVSGTDDNYHSNIVGLRARRADVFFDDYLVSGNGVPVKPNLVGYWKFDEGSGTIAYDSSDYGNDGTLIGGCLWVDGKSGKALWFGGGDSYVIIPHTSDLSFSGVQAFTVEAWIKPEIPQVQSALARNIIDKYSNYGLVYDHPNTDARGFILRSGGSWHYSGEVEISAGTWHHYVGVYDPPYLRAYLDGEEAASREVGYLSLDANSNNVVFGTNMELTSQYTGIIDEIRIYNRALTVQEILEHYTSLQP